MDKIQIIAIIAVLFFIGLITRFIMKGKLRTEYSIIWGLMAVIFLVFSVWRQSLDMLANFFGVYYAPSLIFIFFFFMIFIFLIHLSVVNSKQHDQIKKLAQEISLLKEKSL
ncbi:MAG: DUF2304 domain-containing protein [Bacteroidetes bacterium]|nr:DUF2304 domain-containing protein [Bacteroidota bacterium]